MLEKIQKTYARSVHKLAAARKGAIGLGDLPGLVITVVFVAVIFVAFYLVMGGLNNGITGVTATDNATKAAIGNFTSMGNNVVGYAPTWGILIGVAILVGIVIAAFSVIRGRNGGGSSGF